MDPLTHALAGVVTGGLFGPDGVGVAVAVAGALAPDAEFVTRRIPRTAFLDYHHGLAHTILGGLAAAGATACVAGLVTGRSWASLLPLALAGLASHLVLDLLMHNNGIALLAPFSRRRYSFPLVLGLNPRTASPQCRNRGYGTCLVCQAHGMRLNPFFWVLLAAACATLGAPRLARTWSVTAFVALAGLSLYANRRRSRAISACAPSARGSRCKAFPASHSMREWLVLREEPTEWHATLVDGSSGVRRWERVIARAQPPAAVLATDRLLSVRGFKNSVMFPHWSHEHLDGVDHVTWHDLSYLFSDSVELYALHVRMAEDGRLIQNEFHERW